MSRPVRYLLGAVVAVILLAGSFSGGLIVGWLVPIHNSNAVINPLSLLPFAEQPSGISSGAPEDNQALFKPFWQAWELATTKFVDQPVDTEKMMRGAIRGMLESLENDYTSYMDPVEFQISSNHLNNEYEGIGAWVDTTGNYLKIISPMPGSPAEKAGLQPEDIVLKVDGKDMTGVDGSVVLSYVLGPANSKVTLTIQREGVAEPFDVTIQRARIKVTSVEGKMLDNQIGYIRLSTFGEKTGDELKATLKTLMAQEPKGIILDLRNNGGGYLTTGIQVVSQFIGKGAVMYEIFGDGTRKTYSAEPGGLALDIPLVVLVNKGSASASEITAGAIQDLRRGVLIGETTFGKGEVQQWIPLDDDQGAVRITIARWLTPKERQIQGKGLEPDIAVELSEEDAKNKLDPQLERALEYLLNGK